MYFSWKRSVPPFQSTNFLVKRIWRKLFLPRWQNRDVDYFISKRQCCIISWAQDTRSLLLWIFWYKTTFAELCSYSRLQRDKDQPNYRIIFRQSKCKFHNSKVVIIYILGVHELRFITENIEAEKKRCTVNVKNDKMQMGSCFPYSVWPCSLLISNNTTRSQMWPLNSYVVTTKFPFLLNMQRLVERKANTGVPRIPRPYSNAESRVHDLYVSLSFFNMWCFPDFLYKGRGRSEK